MSRVKSCLESVKRERGTEESVLIEYSKEELNAAIAYLVHMLGLIVRYLGVKLPFAIAHKGTEPHIWLSMSRAGHGR